MKAGQAKFITLEGMEGAGKSTNLAYIRDYLEAHDIDFLVTREPGGTEVAEKIRQILLAEHEESVEGMTELLLIFAARAQHLAKVILPALAEGKWVLCDRFTDATYAYQGGARALGFDKVEALESLVQQGLQPDLTLVLDVPLETSLQRVRARGELDRFEKESDKFFRTVRDAYLSRAASDESRYRVIDASTSLEQVQQQVKAVLDHLLSENA